MRLLLGLALGLALMAQPTAAAPKEDKKDKHEKKEAKAERKAEESESRSERSAPAPAQEPEQPAPTASEAPEDERPSRTPRKQQQPEPTPTASPSHTPVPEPQVPAEPVPTATPVAVASPAPIAAPARPLRPARRERRARRRPQRRRGVLGLTATAPSPARFVVAAVALPPLPRLTPTISRVAPVATRRRSARPRPQPRDASPAAAAVTRVVNVIPAPLRFALIGLIMLVALLALRARRLETQAQDLTEDLGLLQSALLPILPERIGHARISAAYRPAEGLAAGGDFYDAFALDAHRTCLLVGDVAGHGRDAVPLTADVRFTLRAYLEAGLAPRAALRATAAVIEPRLGGRFVTVIVAVLDARTGRLTYAAAGHPPPILAETHEKLVTAASSPAIGSGLPTGHRQTTITLPAGATACFYTDGLCDAKTRGRRLGPEAVAARVADLGRRADASALLARIVRDTDAQPDDMAACLLRPQLIAGTPAQDRVEELELDRPDMERAKRFLLACQVPADDVEVALEAANDLLPVVLEVRCGATGGKVAVHRPEAVALPLA